MPRPRKLRLASASSAAASSSVTWTITGCNEFGNTRFPRLCQAGARQREHVVDIRRGGLIRRNPRRADRDDDKHEQDEDRQRRAQVRGQPSEETTRAGHFQRALLVCQRNVAHCSILGSTAAHNRSAIRLTTITTMTMVNTTPCTIGKSR